MNVGGVYTPELFFFFVLPVCLSFIQFLVCHKGSFKASFLPRVLSFSSEERETERDMNTPVAEASSSSLPSLEEEKKACAFSFYFFFFFFLDFRRRKQSVVLFQRVLEVGVQQQQQQHLLLLLLLVVLVVLLVLLVVELPSSLADRPAVVVGVYIHPM